MVLRFALVLFFLAIVRTSEDSYELAFVRVRDFDDWNLAPDTFKVMKIRKRDTQGQAEGGVVAVSDKVIPAASTVSATASIATAGPVKAASVDAPKHPSAETPDAPKGSANVALNTPKEPEETKPAVSSEDVKSNVTATTASPNTIELSSPGVLKRAAIVFGGFALLGVVYYVVFRRKGKKNETGNNHDDSNQFRYGVLQSDEQRDNLELSRIPLTMDSDDDDDEDLEIFDLEQKKKSLSYVNLQPDDEEFVIDLPNEYEGNTTQENDRLNLLLDIEDKPSDTLIHWSSK